VKDFTSAEDPQPLFPNFQYFLKLISGGVRRVAVAASSSVDCGGLRVGREANENRRGRPASKRTPDRNGAMPVGNGSPQFNGVPPRAAGVSRRAREKRLSGCGRFAGLGFQNERLA
jgi:hypothetical protein